MEIDFIKWLIREGYFNPIFTIDFDNVDWEQVNFEIQTQLSSNEIYKLSCKYFD